MTPGSAGQSVLQQTFARRAAAHPWNAMVGRWRLMVRGLPLRHGSTSASAKRANCNSTGGARLVKYPSAHRHRLSVHGSYRAFGSSSQGSNDPKSREVPVRLQLFSRAQGKRVHRQLAERMCLRGDRDQCTCTIASTTGVPADKRGAHPLGAKWHTMHPRPLHHRFHRHTQRRSVESPTPGRTTPTPEVREAHDHAFVPSKSTARSPDQGRRRRYLVVPDHFDPWSDQYYVSADAFTTRADQ